MSDANDDTGVATLVDGHVHFHPCFEIDRFLAAAAANLDAAGGGAWGRTPRHEVLMLTEGLGERAFVTLRDGLASAAVAGWSARPTAEANSVAAMREDGHLLFLVAGRQIVTGEGIEVLAFNVGSELPDRMSLDETFEAIWEAGSIAVLPWGFGKWWGRRGRLVRDAMLRHHGCRLMLGDNAGRPRRSTEPALFRLARRVGIPVLPGSDPLPFRSDACKVGRYGAVLRSDLDVQRPADSIVRELSRSARRLRPFGSRERWSRFVRLQLAMQWRKRYGEKRR